MIFYFPNLDTLRLAITSGVVPPEVSLAPAVAGFDDAGHLWLEPAALLPRGLQAGLGRLGVKVVKSNGASLTTEVSCWPQVLPVQRGPAPDFTAQTPVLFELSETGQLPALVGEILRLGNDRQGFRWLQEPGAKGQDGHALLRVIGPPYYSLLRA